MKHITKHYKLSCYKLYTKETDFSDISRQRNAKLRYTSGISWGTLLWHLTSSLNGRRQNTFLFFFFHKHLGTLNKKLSLVIKSPLKVTLSDIILLVISRHLNKIRRMITSTDTLKWRKEFSWDSIPGWKATGN